MTPAIPSNSEVMEGARTTSTMGLLRRLLMDLDDGYLDAIERDIHRFEKSGVCSARVLRQLRELNALPELVSRSN